MTARDARFVRTGAHCGHGRNTDRDVCDEWFSYTDISVVHDSMSEVMANVVENAGVLHYHLE
ncbi:hypothetical protein BD413DRAFT_598050 [Trametes elegans]|nr:hypothetical protein BD413DRAFT_598050 [Trametes elegans]